MCENQYNNYYCQNHFYYQYMQQHAAMMHWIQNLHSNIYVPDAQEISHSCHETTLYPKAVHYAPESRVYHASYESGTTLSDEYSSSFTENENHPNTREPEHEEYSEEDDSDCEYELNVDAILAMRKAKEELNKDATDSTTSSSIAMIDHVHEEFEIVELGSLQERQAKKSIMVGNKRDKHAEMQCEKEFKEYLYGEKSTTISGLETAMSLTYERLCDIHQPPVWPVYPLRLTSCVQ